MVGLGSGWTLPHSTAIKTLKNKLKFHLGLGGHSPIARLDFANNARFGNYKL